LLEWNINLSQIHQHRVLWKTLSKLKIFIMAKKSMIEREKKRQALVDKYAEKRGALKEEFAKASSQQERLEIHRKIQQLPRSSAQVRVRNRCWATGRPRGYYRDFGLSRHVLREMAHQGLLPGVVKSSW
jgi:small subunit ribosomal protein S14